MRELLRKEFDDMSIPAVEKNMLWSLLEEYHDAFSLDGERGETDLVELKLTLETLHQRDNQFIEFHLQFARK